jgi:preprotein translocase subunit SecY
VIRALQNVFNIPDLRNRIIFMLALLFVYRVGAHVPIPFINLDRWNEYFAANQGTVLGMLDLFSGGSFGRLTIFALGIMPYITASIILQLLTVVWPYLEKLSKEGELGRRKITTYTRYLTVVLAAVQSGTMALTFQAQGDLVTHPGIGFVLMMVLTLTSGTAFIMWLGEQITERGIGNGMSLIIFAGIVVRLPAAIYEVYQKLYVGDWNPVAVVLLVAIIIAIVGFVVLVERGQRRITVQYAKRVVGRRVLGGQSTHLPLRVNTSGVIPVIFASSILTFPQTFAQMPWFRESTLFQRISSNLASGEPVFVLLYMSAIVFFCYFYTSIIFNPNEIADNMRKYGGFVPGIRPGKRTAEHVSSILTRITLVGALYLAVIAIIPEFMSSGFHVQSLPVIGARLESLVPPWFTTGIGVQLLGGIFGGTSLLIMVGVAMDTVQMVESQLIMRHYDGFLKKGRIRGRRG